MANDIMKARVDELLRVVGHLDTVKRLRGEAQRLGQTPRTLDALDSVIEIDAARAEALLEKIESMRFTVRPDASGSPARSVSH